MFRKLLIDNKYIHEFSLGIAENINGYLDKDGLDKIKLQYGIEIIIVDLTKLIIVIMIAIVLGSLFETILVLTTFNLLRLKAYGVHAGNASQCLSISIILFNIIPYISSFLQMRNIGVIISFIIVLSLLALYSPADTENTPIVGFKRRKKFKIQSIVIALVLMILSLAIKNNSIKLLICIGAVIEAISLMPITYKLLRKERNNYEKHERKSEGNYQ